MLRQIETRLSWRPQDHLPLRDRIVKVGQALLALKEMEHLGASQSGEAGERLPRLLEHLLTPLEREWLGGRHEPDTMACVKRLRSAILPDLVHGELSEAERDRRWSHLADLYLAQQLHDVGNDFFFSGHTALAVLGAVEAARLGPLWLAAVVAVIALGEMLAVLVLRAHYTMDVLAGAFAAFLAAGLGEKLSPVVDAWWR